MKFNPKLLFFPLIIYRERKREREIGINNNLINRLNSEYISSTVLELFVEDQSKTIHLSVAG